MPGSQAIEIAGRRIGQGAPTYIVAELSANHNGELDRAIRLVEAAKNAGADAVKLQTYRADSLTLRSSDDHFRVEMNSRWGGMTLHDLYEDAETPWEWHPRLREVAADMGITLFSSPFDLEAVALLERLNVPAYKIASFELADHHLVRAVARTGKPVIMSTGVSTLDEIGEAIEAARDEDPSVPIALLKCTSAYPASPAEMNLRSMQSLAETFGVPIGLSDHSLGPAVATAAVALGACIVEKHLCLSRSDGGPDAAFSLEPREFEQLVADVRTADAALGSMEYELGPQDLESRKYRRSLYAVDDIRAGELLSEQNVRSIRPGAGLPPKHLGTVLGRRASAEIPRGTPLTWELIETDQ